MKKVILVALLLVAGVLTIASCEKEPIDESTIAIDKDKVETPGQSIDKDKVQSPGGNGNG